MEQTIPGLVAAALVGWLIGWYLARSRAEATRSALAERLRGA